MQTDYVFLDKNMKLMRLPNLRRFSDAELAKLAQFVEGEQLRRKVVGAANGSG